MITTFIFPIGCCEKAYKSCEALSQHSYFLFLALRLHLGVPGQDTGTLEAVLRENKKMVLALESHI